MVDKKQEEKKNIFQQQAEQKGKAQEDRMDPHNPHPRFSPKDYQANDQEKEAQGVGKDRANLGHETYLKEGQGQEQNDASPKKDAEEDAFGRQKEPGQDNADATDKDAVEGNKRTTKKGAK